MAGDDSGGIGIRIDAQEARASVEGVRKVACPLFLSSTCSDRADPQRDGEAVGEGQYRWIMLSLAVHSSYFKPIDIAMLENINRIIEALIEALDRGVHLSTSEIEGQLRKFIAGAPPLAIMKLPILHDKIRVTDSYHEASYKKTIKQPVFVRAIKVDESFLGKPIKYSRIIHPSPGQARLGRANSKGRSIFYCSGHENPEMAELAALYELGAKKGELYIISYWQLSGPLRLFVLGNAVVSARHRPSWQDEECPDPDNAVLGKIFCNPGSRYYPLTSMLAEILLYGILYDRSLIDGHPQGIVYPSVKIDGLELDAKCDNYAITPETFQNSLVWKRSDFVTIAEDAHMTNGIVHTTRMKGMACKLDEDKNLVLILENNRGFFNDKSIVYGNTFMVFDPYGELVF